MSAEHPPPPRRRRGFAVLLTGLPGAGKTTTANALAAMLRERGPRRVTLLDGDAVRRGLSAGLGFSRADREENLKRIGLAAAGAVRGGGIALCAVIAPYADARRALRGTVEAEGGFVEVYVSTPLATCEARDARGLYARARRGLVARFTGIDDPYEPPGSPDVEIDTTDIPPDRAARRVLAALERLGLLRRVPDAPPPAAAGPPGRGGPRTTGLPGMAGVPAPRGGRDGGGAR